MAATFLSAPLSPEFIAPALTLVTFCLFLKALHTDNKKLIFEKEQIIFIAFICWQIVGIFYSKSFVDSIVTTLTGILLFFGYIFVSNLINSRERLDKILFAATLSGGIAGAMGIGQILLFHFGGYIAKPLKTMFNPFWRNMNVYLVKMLYTVILPKKVAGMLPHVVQIDIVTRANSTFTNPVFFACFLVMVLPFAAYCFFYLKDKRKKWISLVCAVMIAGGVASSYSRGPYLAAAVTVFVLLFMGRKQAIKMLAVSPLLLLLIPTGVFKRLLSLLGSGDISINTRSAIWADCIEILKKKWLFGMGPGVANVRKLLVGTYGINQPHAHNIILQLMLEGGIIGTSIFVAAIVFIIVEMVKLGIRSKEGRSLGVAVIASITGFLTCGMTDYVIYGAKVLQYFMMILGLALAARRIFLEVEAKKHEIPEPEK